MQETHRIELKVQLTDDLEKEVVAFLNTREGGKIYLGYTDDGNPRGVSSADKDLLKIKDRLKHNISPSIMGLYDLELQHVDGKDIIKLSLASGFEKPYFLTSKGMSPKGCYIRKGTAAEPMEQRLIDTMYAKRTRNSIGKIKSNRQDLTFEQLKIYYEGKGTPLNKNFAKSLELLDENGDYNFVAYLMADENGTSIKVAKYKGLNRSNLIENPDYGYASLIKSAKSVLVKIEIENRENTEITSTTRKDKRPWSPIALREAILNAFVHNDYTTEVPPKFEIFDDRIEITSSGGLPQGLNLDEFYEGYSVPRNKELMRIFKDVGLVEQLGSGVPRILESYDKSCFHFSDHFLRMTFPKKVESNQVGNQGGPISGPVGGPIGGPIELTDRQKEVLLLIKKDAKLTKRGLAATLGVNVSAAQAHLDNLKDKGVIKREGGTRGYWKILIEI